MLPRTKTELFLYIRIARTRRFVGAYISTQVSVHACTVSLVTDNAERTTVFFLSKVFCTLAASTDIRDSKCLSGRPPLRTLTCLEMADGGT